MKLPRTRHENAGPVSEVVAHERDGLPSVGIVTALTDDGRRLIANARDVDMLHDMTVHPWEGRRAKITNDGSSNSISD